MHTHVDKTQENKSQSVSAANPQIQKGGESTYQFVDNRPETVAQRKLQEIANSSQQLSQLKVIQAMANRFLLSKRSSCLKTEVVIQRMLGFGHLNKPKGYGAVVLSANLNGIDIGEAWSKKSAYSLGTIHAEDDVIDFIENLEGIKEKEFAWKYATEEERQLALTLNRQKKLIINGLSASPCTSVCRGNEMVSTCKKGDLEGCTERLIKLAELGYSIIINAQHYYQPSIVGGKNASIAAVLAMRDKGIIVNIEDE